jgi:Rrf2 family protein
MKFTKKTDYALRSLQFLARRHFEGAPLPVPVQTISDQCHLSQRFLHGIVSKLSKAKLLRTIPGVKGGVTLSRDPEKITILQIIEAVEGRISLMDCMEHPEQCGDSTGCSIMGVLHTAQAAMMNSLSNTNLKLMVKAKNDPFPHRSSAKALLKPEFGCPVLK